MTAEPLEFDFGEGQVVCDAHDGSVFSVSHPAHPDMNFLLDESVGDWHNASYRWGKGFVISSAGSARWDFPAALERHPQGINLRYDLLPDLSLSVERRFGSTWTETYALCNAGPQPITLGSLAISTPWRDLYNSARECLTGACSAHLWTGGSLAYVGAAPMNGQPPILGLTLERGELWSYSVESRNAWTGGVRGHLYLHLTDAARNPGAMGGQPSVTLAPGETYTLGWRLEWLDCAAPLEALVSAVVTLPRLASPIGTPLLLEAQVKDLQVSAAPEVRLEQVEGGFLASCELSGVQHLDLTWSGGRSRVGVLFHQPLRELTERRTAFILEHQRAVERDPSRRGSFLPLDTRSMLRVNKDNWLDWSDARERLAMPILLQETLRRGWGERTTLEAALGEFDSFARTHLVDEPSGTVYEDSFRREPRRLYNFPWLADFFTGQYELFGREGDLQLATRIVLRYYALEGGIFLAIGVGELLERLLNHLSEAGQFQQRQALETHLLEHAAYFVGLGTDLPQHEMSYEQSIVSPLVSLLSAAYRLQPSDSLEQGLRRSLRWLETFAGGQPHVRLRHIPIRHWDGYWFGVLRQWGDLFPHHWSVLSAASYCGWPEALGGKAALEDKARIILAANLAHFHDDGSATCAFIYPSCVEGNPAHLEDPLANDQDWALVYALRYAK